MAGKRSAGYDLNADNWDNEEEPEEKGVFQTASHDELKNRVIKKARRKMSSSGEVAKLGAFSSFSGNMYTKIKTLTFSNLKGFIFFIFEKVMY